MKVILVFEDGDRESRFNYLVEEVTKLSREILPYQVAIEVET